MADEMRVVKRRRITGNIITVNVGKGATAETFLLHDFMLKEHSQFFKAALSGQWREGQDKKVELPDDDPEAFSVYTEWLFSGKIATAASDDAAQPSKNDMSTERVLQAKLYVLGEKLIDDQFCDCSLRAISEMSGLQASDGEHYYPGPAIVKIIYEGTTQASPVRRYLVDLYSRHASEEWYSNTTAQQFPLDFLLDLAKMSLPWVKTGLSKSPQKGIETFMKCQ